MSQVEKLAPFLLVGGLVVWIASRREKAPANGEDPNWRDPWFPENGENGDAYYPGGPAMVGGQIGDITLEARPGELGLRAHRLERVDGDLLEIAVTWQQTTTDFEGDPISWPARITAELGHSTNLGTQWSDMRDLLGSGGIGGRTQSGAAPGAHAENLVVIMGSEPNPPQDWDARVTLEMQGSTATGTPDGIWSQVSRETHEDAVRSIRTTGRSSVGGSVGSISVNPYTAGLGPYIGDPYTGGIYAQSSKGGRMKRLGMRQQRPPWGFSPGHEEVRQWPRSDRNPMLPGVKIMVRQEGRVSAGSVIGPGRRMYAV